MGKYQRNCKITSKSIEKATKSLSLSLLSESKTQTAKTKSTLNHKYKVSTVANSRKKLYTPKLRL